MRASELVRILAERVARGVEWADMARSFRPGPAHMGPLSNHLLAFTHPAAAGQTQVLMLVEENVHVTEGVSRPTEWHRQLAELFALPRPGRSRLPSSIAYDISMLAPAEAHPNDLRG